MKYREIDYARGIATILIVIGHVITQVDSQHSTIFLAVLGGGLYSFHIYVFFFVSGFVSTKDLYKSVNKHEFIKKRALKLLVPYFTMGIIYIPLRLFMSKYARNPFLISDSWKILIGQNPDGSLWFLYMLFLISVVTIFTFNEKTNKMCLIITGVAWMVSCIIQPENDIVLSLSRYTFMYMLGTCSRIYYANWLGILKEPIVMIVALIAFVIGNTINYKFNTEAMLPITAVTGTTVILGLAKLFDSKGKHKKLIDIVSANCMEIYIFSEPMKVVLRLLINRSGINYYVGLMLIICGAILLPVLFAKFIVKRSKILSFLFLGRINNAVRTS